MINERVDAEKYLRGEGLYHDIEYRICFLLSKLFYEQGNTTASQIRDKLKEWAKDNKFYLKVSMNSIIERVIEREGFLSGQTPIHISSGDVAIIKDRFDTYEERLVALAILCYAKAYADASGQFTLSVSALSHWLTFQPKHLRKYLNRLINLEYITLVTKGDINSWYRSTVVITIDTYKINAPYDAAAGEFELIDNNIEQLYEDAFLDTTWYSIPGYRGWYKINEAKDVKVCERVIGERHYYGKVLQPTASTSGRLYVNLLNENGKQIKCSLDNLYELARKNA